MKTKLPNYTVTNRQFRKPGILLDLDTSKKYPLKEGDQTIGRRDDDSNNNGVRPDIAIETNDMYMSRIHLHINVEMQDRVFYHKIWIPKETKNNTRLNNEILPTGYGKEKLYEKNQVISMPLAKIKIVEE